MRVAWFTPGAGSSGVVDYSRRVLAALQTVADPVLFTPGPAEGFPSALKVYDFVADPDSLETLEKYDAVFYNLGNHHRYHGAIWDVARSVPGIVVLHDRILHHFFLGYFADRLKNPAAYRERMIQLYGWQGARFADRMLARHDEPDPEELLTYSFIEEALRVAKGVVVHSRWHADAVRAVWGGPVCTLWLPVQSRQGAKPASTLGATAAAGDRRVALVTLGHVEFNKHPDKVVLALARDLELSARARYLIGGSYRPDSDYVRQLGRVITGNSLARTVRLLGYLSPGELDSLADSADVFINIRDPNFEGCSASLMYELPLGKPVVVYDSGSFSEVPDNAVVKVSPGDQPGLARVLWELVNNEPMRLEIGKAGQRFAERWSLPAYAGALADFAADVAAWAPRIKVADRVGRTLAELGIDPTLCGVERITQETVELFDYPRPSDEVPGGYGRRVETRRRA